MATKGLEQRDEFTPNNLDFIDKIVTGIKQEKQTLVRLLEEQDAAYAQIVRPILRRRARELRRLRSENPTLIELETVRLPNDSEGYSRSREVLPIATDLAYPNLFMDFEGELFVIQHEGIPDFENRYRRVIPATNETYRKFAPDALAVINMKFEFAKDSFLK
jgi:hypothetical protein